MAPFENVDNGRLEWHEHVIANIEWEGSDKSCRMEKDETEHEVIDIYSACVIIFNIYKRLTNQIFK